MRAVHLTAFGNPVDGLEFVDISEPDAPGPNQVLTGVEFSPVNPNDLMLAQGIYAIRPALPTVIGNEGVGRVLAVGPGVDDVKVGDRVLVPLSSFAWRERLVTSTGVLFALPPDADPQQLAMLGINPPTASLLLSEYVDLKSGDWVVQNAANSGVGRWVIALAKARGLRTSGARSWWTSLRRSAETSSSSIRPMSRDGSEWRSARTIFTWHSTA
jgi:NADPH:quinone reductase-like Zn-dependent oxidoreductase